VLIYVDVRDANAATVRKILRFLGVDETVTFEALEVNPAARVRSVRLDALVRRIGAGKGPVARAARAPLKALTSRALRARLLQATRRKLLYAKPPPPDEAFMRQLRIRFEPEVVALSEYLGRDLVAEWGYGDLG